MAFELYAPIREAVWAMIMGCVPVSVVWQTNGVTPLYAASNHGHVEVVRALVGAGAAVNQAAVRDDVLVVAFSCVVWSAACVCSFFSRVLSSCAWPWGLR